MFVYTVLWFWKWDKYEALALQPLDVEAVAKYQRRRRIVHLIAMNTVGLNRMEYRINRQAFIAEVNEDHSQRFWCTCLGPRMCVGGGGGVAGG